MSSLALVVLSVPLLLVALAIRFDSPGPPLFRQVRVGRDEQLQIQFVEREPSVRDPDTTKTGATS